MSTPPPEVPESTEPLPEEQPRRFPSTIGGVCYLLILIATAAGIVIVLRGEWRGGVRVIGAALVAASLLRLALRQRDAGMLAVRHRLIDVVLLLGVGLALIFLAGSIPDQPV